MALQSLRTTTNMTKGFYVPCSIVRIIKCSGLFKKMNLIHKTYVKDGVISHFMSILAHLKLLHYY